MAEQRPVPRAALELEGPEPPPCPHCLPLALCPASPRQRPALRTPCLALSAHRGHASPPREPVQGLALRGWATGLLPPPSAPQPALALQACCQHAHGQQCSPGHGVPTPAPVRGGRELQAPTYPVPEQSEAGAADGSACRGQRFYAGLASAGRSWPRWGHVARSGRAPASSLRGMGLFC